MNVLFLHYGRGIKQLSTFLSLLIIFSGFPLTSSAQTNVALTATPSHTVGGAGVYDPSNYNDGIIVGVTDCSDATTPWGWTTTTGQILYTWAAPETFDKVVFYKSNRAWTSATVSYWNGSAYVTLANITGTGICPVDSITFPPVTTTQLLINNFAGASNPNHREIQVWSTPTVTCTTPTAQATSLTLTPGLYTASASFTAPSSAPDRYFVVRTTTSTPPATPVDGVNYAPGSTALGGTIVGMFPTTSFTATGLTPGTNYWFWIYSANAFCMGGPLYYTTSPLSGTVTTNTCSLSGVKTIGPSGDYATFTAAIAAINNNGLSGPLALEIQTTYTGAGETLPVVIDSIPCGSSTNTLTIRPQGTLTISAPGAPMFVLNGARNVIIDGRVGSTGTTKALTISNTATTGSTIVFQNDASYNTVKYCRLESVNTSTANASILFSTTIGITGNDNNLIDNCDITDGSTQPIYGILSAGTADKENSENTVSNCNISNFFMPSTTASGIMLNAGSSAWTISNNRFFQTAARSYTGTAVQRVITINNVDGINFQVTGNTIGYASSTGTGLYTISSTGAMPFMAILLDVGNAIPSTVSGNTISGISFTTTSGLLTGISVTDGNVNISGNTIGGATGTGAITKTNSTTSSPAVVGINAGAATPDIINITNNVIGSITTNGSTTSIGAGITGIVASSTAAVTITGNTIGSTTTTNSINSATASTGTQLVYGINASITSSATTPPVISNNTIANLNAEGTGTSSFAAGILYSSTSSPTISGNTIRNISSASANTALTGQAGVSGIVYTGTTGTPVISQNTINAIVAKNTGSVTSNAAGISYTGAVNGSIMRNKIYDIRNLSTSTSTTAPPKAIGIFCYNPSTSVSITNNMVTLGNGLTNNTAFAGIMQGGTSSAATMQIYHNTVNIEGTVTSGALPSVALLRGNFSTTAYTTTFDVRNNILVNNRSGGTGKHYAIANNLSVTTANATGWGANASNYNILNTANSATLGYWAADRTFATWKSNSLSDENSYNATTVTFTATSTGDLHINMGTTANNIESHATTIAAVSTDIDGQVRPGPAGSVNGGGLTPDIGADEFDGVPIDNLPPNIIHTVAAGGCGTGNQTLTATISDYSGVPATVTNPRIYYKKGAAGTWYSKPGTLTSGTVNNGTWSFTMLASDMGGLAVGDQVFYYVIAQDNLGQIISLPSAGLVATNVNSVTTPPTSPYSFTVLNSMNGPYNIGAGGDFATITAAVAAYNAACLAGPVTFNLTDATYTGETFPITIATNNFAGAGTVLTIRPAAGTAVTIDGSSSAPAIFKLVNARYVTIDGINTGGATLTLNSANTGANAVIWLASTASVGPGNNNITLKNMNINGGITTGTTNFGIVANADATNPAASTGMDNDYITIQGNSIQRCYYGIYCNGAANAVAGGNNNWTISNNIIGPATPGSTDIGGWGIWLQNAQSLTISGNNIRNVNTTATQTGLIRLATNVNGFSIRGNTLESSSSSVAASSTSSFSGIYLGTNVINGSVAQNSIHGLSNTNTSGYGVRAILMNTASNSSNDTIVNNMISDLYALSDASTTAIYAVMGIDIDAATGGVKVCYNSVDLSGDHTGLTTATQSMCFFTNTSGGGLEVHDNIFRNTYDNTSSILDKGYAIFSLAPVTAFAGINYNDYYVSGTHGILGYMANADRTTMSAIQTYFGGNANSINVNPIFVGTTDLHLQVDGDNVPLIAGTPIAGINTDFDGTVRSGTTPVLGAHEVYIPPCNVVTGGTISATASSMCVSGSTPVSVTGASVGIGISRQWQSSTDSLSWTPIAGVTSTSYTTPVITGTTYYRMIISCSLSGQKDSVTKKITINPAPLPITGTTSACVGGSATLSSATSGGTWSSNNTSAVTISSGGVATAVASGNSKINYTITATGCSTSTYFSVVTPPSVPVITPPSAVLCHGQNTLLDASSVATGTSNFASGTINVAVPDYTNVGAYTSLSANLPAGAIITGASVNFNITTTYVGDLNINLTAPNGKTLNLFNMLGGAGLDFVNTTVSSSATADFASASAPYTGTYAATAATGDLGAAGYPVNTTSWDSLYTIPGGAWTLSARDGGPNDFAFITSWTLTLNYRLPVALTWSPTADLYTDAGLTTAYTGADAASLYAAPTAPGSVATVSTYTITSALTGCATTSAATASVSVNPLPAVIAGPATLCEGLSYNLSNADAGGTWSSNNTSVATIGSATGVVDAVVPGVATISYIFTGTGCTREKVVTVNSLPAPITGTPSVCEAATTTLADATPGGSWISGSTFVATADAATGVMTGVSAGLSVITYMLPTGCISTVQGTVNPVPVNTVTPSSVTICEGENAWLVGNASLPDFSLLSQNFNGGLGAWTITNLLGDAASFWKITSAPTTGSTGDGTPMASASPVDFAGVTHTILTSPSFSTVGYGAATLTFNQTIVSLSSSDAAADIEYSINGGASWNTLLSQLDVSSGTGTWTVADPEVTIALPSAALNVPDVKLRWNYNSNFGLWWDLDNISVKASLIPATPAWAGVSGASGLTCTTCNTVNVTPAATGANLYEFTATTASGCATTNTVTVNVNPVPDVITGTSAVLCEGTIIVLGNTTPGGTWSSSHVSIANANASTGEITGVNVGTSVISYILPTSCKTTAIVTVNQAPAPITGTFTVCEDLTTALGNTVTGGAWTSSNTVAATIDATGLVTGNNAGNSVITYELPSGCIATANLTVNPKPAAITGTMAVCENMTTSLSSASAGGDWTSSSSSVATIDIGTGVVSGLNAGTSIISYTFPTTCKVTAIVTVNQAPAAITGALAVCEDITTALGNTVTGGTWTSSNTTAATIDASGLATGHNAGNSMITYELSSGCTATANLTVNPKPAVITGTMDVCESMTTSLSSASAGGTWTSLSSSNATIDIGTGVVGGVNAGTSTIVYVLPTGCERQAEVTVNALPANITGTMAVCEGLVTTLSNTTAGGTWGSSDVSVATIDASGDVSGLVFGTTSITYILGTGCYKTETVTVNALPAPITGVMEVCEGLTTLMTSAPADGTWNSSAVSVASIGAASGLVTGNVAGTATVTYTLPTGCIRSADVTVNALPADITGIMEVCEGLTTNLTSATGSGTWSSDDLSVAGVDASGMVTGNVSGNANIVYTLPTGCLKMANVTVNALPAPIGGATQVCEGLTASLSNTTPGGFWTSAAATTADVDLSSGVMTGIAAGTTTVTYTLLTGCLRTGDVTVNALPAMITGTPQVCAGLTTTLTNATTGGMWSNDLSGIASVDATGIVTGTTAGISGITYTLPATGCLRAVDVTVNALPTVYNVNGGGAYCAGTSGVSIGADGSQVGVDYQLYFGAAIAGFPSPGTGAAFSFGTYTTPGTYTIFAQDATTGCVNNMAGSATVTITPLNIPSVALTTPATTVCATTMTNYTATPVNGGTLPVYDWRVNGIVMSGATSATFNYTPLNGDVVTVTLNSNEICAIPSTAADTLTMTVNPNEMPVATISVPNTTVCAGSGATFSVVPTFGGTAPSYKWYTNSAFTGVTGTTYTYVPANGDVVTARMASNFTCRAADTVTSNALTITTTPILLPLITLSASPGTIIPSGTPVTFTATLSGIGGATPSYQWVVNSSVIPGATNATYTTSTLNNNDSVTCKVSISDPCGFENFNSLVMRVKPVGIGQVTGQADIALFPNPNKGEFVVKGTLYSDSDEEITMEVVNLIGQTVYAGNTVVKNGVLNEKIRLSNTLANGMYMLNIHTAAGSQVLHFVLEQ